MADIWPGVPQDAGAVTLDDAHKTFIRWLGDDYDLDALDAMLAAAAVERLDGDPLWLLIISRIRQCQNDQRPCKPSAVLTRRSSLPSHPKVRCCQPHPNGNGPRTPPADFSTKSGIMASLSSKMSPRFCR